MKIFGRTFVTKKELKRELAQLKIRIGVLEETFPLKIGQVIYDVQLRDDQGRYSREETASQAHSTIIPIAVNRRNYFNLVERYSNKSHLFTCRENAEKYLLDVFTRKGDLI